MSIFETILKDLRREERGYAKNIKRDKGKPLAVFWEGCANGIGRAIELITYHLQQEDEP